MAFRIKSIHKNTIVGFNNSGKPLGERDDLHILYELGKKNPSILNYFEEEPTDEKIEDLKDKEAVKNPKFASKLRSYVTGKT